MRIFIKRPWVIPGTTRFPEFNYGFADSFLVSLRFAFLVARRKLSKYLEETHILAGIYLAHWEKIKRYWRMPEENEKLVAGLCGVSRPRSFFETRYREKYDADNAPRAGPAPDFWTYSETAAKILDSAVEIAQSRAALTLGPPTIVTPEDFLLAAAQCADLVLSRRLVASGLDVQELEIAVRAPLTDHK